MPRGWLSNLHFPWTEFRRQAALRVSFMLLPAPDIANADSRRAELVSLASRCGLLPSWQRWLPRDDPTVSRSRVREGGSDAVL